MKATMVHEHEAEWAGILDYARRQASRPSLVRQEYHESCKRRIARWGLTPRQYEQAIQTIAEVLGL